MHDADHAPLFPSARGRFNRREILGLGIGAFVVASIPFAARRQARHRRLVRKAMPVMGTIADLAVVHDDPQRARAALEAALAELRAVDRGMTRFTTSSDVGRANALAAREAVEVTPPTAQVVAEALRWADASDGAFDPCLGRVSQLWDVTRRSEPPPTGELLRYADRQLYRAVEQGGSALHPTVRFNEPDAALDLGGIAKGFGVDRAVDALRAHGIRDGLVNVGGDLYVLGSSEDGDPWRVGVRSPADPSRLSRTLELRDTAVATSGDTERAFRHAGRRYHHLMDTRSAAPRASREHSLTVVADTCMTADAAATTAFGMNDAAARALLAACAPDASLVGNDARGGGRRVETI